MSPTVVYIVLEKGEVLHTTDRLSQALALARESNGGQEPDWHAENDHTLIGTWAGEDVFKICESTVSR